MDNFKYYVYLHKRLTDNKIFYIGKGNGYRAYAKNKRNAYWNNVVNKHGYYVEYAAKNLSEDQAFELEMFLIQECKDSEIKLTNMTNGGEGDSGAVHSLEVIEKRKKSLLSNLEYIEKIRQRCLKLNKENNPAYLRAFKVKCIDDDKTFKSIRDAAKYYNLDNSYLSKHLKGMYATVKNKTFIKI